MVLEISSKILMPLYSAYYSFRYEKMLFMNYRSKWEQDMCRMMMLGKGTLELSDF